MVLVDFDWYPFIVAHLAALKSQNDFGYKDKISMIFKISLIACVLNPVIDVTFW